MTENFSSELLNLGILYGTTSTYTFDTSIVENQDGTEQRNILWQQPLCSFELGNTILNFEQLEALLQFHSDRKGQNEGFRFRDWADYKLQNELLGNGDGSPQTYQIVNRYFVGGAVQIRPITKIRENTVEITQNGITLNPNSYTLDNQTGLVTTAATGELRISCKFDVPVRFDTDRLDLSFRALEKAGVGVRERLFELQNVTLREIRDISYEGGNIPSIDLPAIPSFGIDLGTLNTPEYATKIFKAANNWEARQDVWIIPKKRWQIGERTLNSVELKNLIAFFRCARGKAIAFEYYDWADDTMRRVRFDQDNLTVQFEAFQKFDTAVIFRLPNLVIRELRTDLGGS